MTGSNNVRRSTRALSDRMRAMSIPIGEEEPGRDRRHADRDFQGIPRSDVRGRADDHGENSGDQRGTPSEQPGRDQDRGGGEDADSRAEEPERKGNDERVHGDDGDEGADERVRVAFDHG